MIPGRSIQLLSTNVCTIFAGKLYSGTQMSQGGTQQDSSGISYWWKNSRYFLNRISYVHFFTWYHMFVYCSAENAPLRFNVQIGILAYINCISVIQAFNFYLYFLSGKWKPKLQLVPHLCWSKSQKNTNTDSRWGCGNCSVSCGTIR